VRVRSRQGAFVRFQSNSLVWAQPSHRLSFCKSHGFLGPRLLWRLAWPSFSTIETSPFPTANYLLSYREPPTNCLTFALSLQRKSNTFGSWPLAEKFYLGAARAWRRQVRKPALRPNHLLTKLVAMTIMARRVSAAPISLTSPRNWGKGLNLTIVGDRRKIFPYRALGACWLPACHFHRSCCQHASR
jgi:hypothetical protein